MFVFYWSSGFLYADPCFFLGILLGLIVTISRYTSLYMLANRMLMYSKINILAELPRNEQALAETTALLGGRFINAQGVLFISTNYVYFLPLKRKWRGHTVLVDIDELLLVRFFSPFLWSLLSDGLDKKLILKCRDLKSYEFSVRNISTIAREVKRIHDVIDERINTEKGTGQ